MFEQVMAWWPWLKPSMGVLADIITLFTVVTAAVHLWKVRREQNRSNKRIGIVLKASEQYQLSLPKIRRANLSRSEILGYIGMLPTEGGKRFTGFNYLNSQSFFEQLEAIQNSNTEVDFIIKCSEADLEQFQLDQSDFSILDRRKKTLASSTST